MAPKKRPEDLLAPIETQFGERIARHDIERQSHKRGARGEQKAVGEIPAHPLACEQLAVVGKSWLLRKYRWGKGARLSRSHERDREHPHERKEGECRRCDERPVDGNGCRAQLHGVSLRRAT